MSVMERQAAHAGRDQAVAGAPPTVARHEVRVYSIGEVATIIQRTRETTLKYARSGLLKGRETPGGWLFSSRCVRAFLGESVEFSDLNEPVMNGVATGLFLGRTPKTISKYVAEGLIPAAPGRQIRCSKDALLQWLELR